MKYILTLFTILVMGCSNTSEAFSDAAGDIYDYIKSFDNKASGKFWVIDLEKSLGDVGYFYEMDFTKRYENSAVEIYVETALTHTLDTLIVDALGSEFRDVIDPAVRDVYRSPSDIDNNDKVIILLYDIKDGYTGSGGYVGGYFYNGDLFSQRDILNSSYPFNTIKSNEAEVLYIDMVQQDVTDAQTKYTIGHEYQHLVGYNQRFNVHGNNSTRFHDTWILEGMAENMEYLIYGQSALDARAHYLASNFDPNTSLVVWNDDDRLSSYALSATYFNFLVNKVGNEEFLHTLNIQHDEDHIGIGKVLDDVYGEESHLANFQKSFTEFAIDGLYKVKDGIFPTMTKGSENSVPGKFTGISSYNTLSFADKGFVPRFFKFTLNSSVQTNGAQLVIDLSETTSSIIETTSISSIGNFQSSGSGVAFVATPVLGNTNITITTNGSFISSNRKKRKSTYVKPYRIHFDYVPVRLDR